MYCATIGFFDGVHRGHQYLISCLREEAARRGMSSAILTFEEHPENVLRGANKPLLTTFEERTERLKLQHVDEIFCFNFSVIQLMTAEEFMQVLVSNCDVRVLLMGYDHHFGSDHLSSFTDYQAAAERVGLILLPIEQAPEGDVSSSKIRRALQLGSVSVANAMLGYPYTLMGEVVHGRGLGRGIGFPTANLHVPSPKLLPAAGVYRVECYLPQSPTLKPQSPILNPQPALLNIGTNPTVGGDTLTVELHIPGFAGDLYGERVTVSLLEFLREEQHFDSVDQLRAQIGQDLLKL